MRDNNYINIQKTKNDWLWRQKEKRLYYSYKNENYIIPTILFCFFLLFIQGGIVGIILLLSYIFYLCYKNNKELDNDYNILKKKKKIKKYRMNYMNEKY